MSVRSKPLIFIMSLFICNIPGTIAGDILSYAEEWEQRNVAKESRPGSAKDTAGDKRDSVNRLNRNTGVKPRVSHSTPNTGVKRKATVTETKKNRTSEITIPLSMNKDGSDEYSKRSGLLSEHFDPQSGSFFQWLRKAVRTLKGEPDKQTLIVTLRESKEEISQAKALLSEQERKFTQQHSVIVALQKKLKDLQYPSLPAEEAGKEDLAAGMAAGFGLNELIATYESYGSQLNKKAFIQGLNDAINGEMRLSAGEYETLLSGANDRYRLAGQQYQIKREKSHKNWKLSTFREADKTTDGISYKIIYPGDKNIDPDERIIISLSRYTPEGELLEDTDIDGRKIEITLNNYSSLLKNILVRLRLHGEASVAMPVNQEGVPDLQGIFFEKWNVRISESV